MTQYGSADTNINHGIPDCTECASLEQDLVQERSRRLRLVEALVAAMPQLHWANLHGSRCEELLAQCQDALNSCRSKAEKCQRCDGCGRIADSNDGEPWTAWANLPPGSDLAVRMGIVKPIDCPACGGTGGNPNLRRVEQ